MPITTAQNLFPDLSQIRHIFIRVDDWNSVDWVRDTAHVVLRVSHKGYDHALRVIYHPERIKIVKSLIYFVKVFVYASIIVTIVLGGIGISNVMLAAVRDRTKEIGLRKALGAKQETILLQFLTEATFLGCISGLIGVTAGITGVLLLKNVLTVTVSTMVLSFSVVAGLIFTIALGIISGLYPSVRASRLDPVDAMRFE